MWTSKDCLEVIPCRWTDKNVALPADMRPNDGHRSLINLRAEWLQRLEGSG